MITTVGRVSGKPRSLPLLYAPDDDGFVVIGSNFGRPDHPSWSANLLANPSAVVQVDGQTVRVTATYARGAERRRLLDLLVGYWPAYETYTTRAANRELRVFRLVPTLAVTASCPDDHDHGCHAVKAYRVEADRFASLAAQ
jgi:deazaflavin-dependent oxidoreductase (nitroreductase family)